MRISVVIVNYNGQYLLHDCLSGLEAQTQAPDEVIVVDNASTDESVGLIQAEYPWVDLIQSQKNLGFAGGNNLGIRASCGDIVVLLNNDTVASPGFIEQIAAPLEDDPKLSAVAGVLLFSSKPQTVATSGVEVYANGLTLDRDTGESWRDLPKQQYVFGPSGGATALRRTALDDVDLFPEPFFLYLEDADLAWRLRLRGHETISRTGAWALHVYSASSGEGSPLKDYFLARNRAWTLIRCWPATFWRTYWLNVILYELGAIGFALITRRWASIRGRIDGWTAVRRLARVRNRIQRRSTTDANELLYWLRSAPSVRNIFRLRRVIRSAARLDEDRDD